MRLLVLTEGPDFVCYRYRVGAFAEALATRGWVLEPLAPARGVAGFLRQLPRFAAADAVLLQRRLLSWWKLRLLRQAAKALIFDFDDAIFLRDSNRKSPHSRVRRRRFQRAVRTSDVCLAGNDFLREQAAACEGKARLYRVPTSIDCRRYSVANHVRRGGQTQLAWIGSRSTLPSLLEAHPGLREAAAQVPGLSLKVVCDSFPELPGIEVVPCPWSEATEAEELAAADIGIAWQPDHPWSLGKCGLKVLQYMAAGLPVVANPIGVHRELIVDGQTGFLAATPEAWARSIAVLADSPDLRRRMGASGRERVVQHYSVDHWGPQFAAAIDEVRRSAARISPHSGADTRPGIGYDTTG